MKKLTVLAILIVTAITANAQENDGATITVTVENVLSEGGSILAGLHTSDTFMKGIGIANAMSPAKAGEVSLVFENVAPGTYAIMVMHDKNDNKQMDMENGMPKESYATTGEMNLYGPPTFDGAKFEVTDTDQAFRIRF
ncbi:DUF2141 domain-containing protein [Maribacter algicola]|uniref:DUF2141 domain-containing protein n=1 Tax=Meishania litoralis TaxID=3434685 RepID=A0ACC7LKL0_9FLAO